MAALTKGKTDRGRPFEVLRILRMPLEIGMEYSMSYDSTVMGGPNVPPPIPRQSLAQTVIVHRYQQSKYFSRLRNYGLRPDYPIAHGHVVVQTGNSSVNNAPTITSTKMGTDSSLGVPQVNSAGAQGFMRPGGRFRKALPLPVVNYNPPIYGGG